MKKLIAFNVVIWIIAISIPYLEKNVVKNSIAFDNLPIINQLQVNRERECRNAKNYELTLETDLRTKSHLDSEDYNEMLSGTELYGIGYALAEAEEKYSVNGLYLMGLCCLESAYGSSGYARNRNNLVGWNAVDWNPDQATYFNSKAECILFVADKLSNNYLSENGCYFSGYTASAVDVHYCTDKLHANKIIKIVNNLQGGR